MTVLENFRDGKYAAHTGNPEFAYRDNTATLTVLKADLENEFQTSYLSNRGDIFVAALLKSGFDPAQVAHEDIVAIYRTMAIAHGHKM